jgi:hypothetical protein
MQLDVRDRDVVRVRESETTMTSWDEENKSLCFRECEDIVMR